MSGSHSASINNWNMNRSPNNPTLPARSWTKALAVFLALFFGFFYYFGNEEVRSISSHRQIAQSPGLAAAVFDGIEGGSTERASYRVQFKYLVAGTTYRLSTTSTDKAGAQSYLREVHQVIYDTRNPSVATLKRYFDLKSRGENAYFQSLVVTGVLALLLSLPLTLLAAVRLGWVRFRFPAKVANTRTRPR